MTFTTKEIADFSELINQALDNIPVENKIDFIHICEGLQDILEPGIGKTPEDTIIQEYLLSIKEILDDAENLGYIDVREKTETEKKEILSAFQDIIRTRITLKIKEFESMTDFEQTRYIQDQENKANTVNTKKTTMEETITNPIWKTKQKRYNTEAEETYEQMLARRQQEFATIGILPIFGSRDQTIEIRNDQNEVIVTNTELNSLPIETRMQFLRNRTAINVLITKLHISFNQLSIIAPEVRNELILNIRVVDTLCSYGNIGITQLIAMPSEIRRELIIYSHSYIGLKTTKNISINELTSLNLHTIRTLLADPNSSASRSILEEIESSRSRFTFCSIS